MANIKLADREGNLTIEVPKEIANADPNVYVPWAFDNNPYSFGTNGFELWLDEAFRKISKRQFGWRWFAKSPATYLILVCLVFAVFSLVTVIQN